VAEIGYEQSVLSKVLDKSIEQMLAVVPRVSSDPNLSKKTFDIIELIAMPRKSSYDLDLDINSFGLGIGTV